MLVRTRVSLEISHTLSNAADFLRIDSFPGPNYKTTSKDEFDDHSYHMSLCIDDSIAAYSRLTPGPNAVFNTWTHGKSELPNDTLSIDLGRVFVNTDYKGLGLFNYILLQSCLISYYIGFEKINGTYIPEEKFVKRNFMILVL